MRPSRIDNPALTRALYLLVLLVALPATGGCGGNTTVSLDPQERVKLQQRATDLLLRAAQADDPLVRANAIEALAKVAPDEGLPRFRSALGSSSPLVRSSGLKALGGVRDRQSRPAFQRHLADPHPLVRLAAAFAAYRCGDTQAARLLVEAMNDSPEESVRAEAATLIGLLEESRARKRLRAALRIRANERSPIVRTAIYTAMASLGDDDALQHLIQYSQHDALSRLLALQSLAELGDPRARDALLYRLGEREDYLLHRLIAARGLARLGSREGFELALACTQYAGNDAEDPEDICRVRLNAALVLGEIGDPQPLATLERMAEPSNDPRIQVAACYAICRILDR